MKTTSDHTGLTLSTFQAHRWGIVIDFSDGGADPLLEPPYHVREASEEYRARGVYRHGGLFSCDLCGAHYRHGSLFAEVEDEEGNPIPHGIGRVISVGHTCARKVELYADWSAIEAGVLERAAKAKRMGLRALERKAAWSERLAWGRANRELLRILRTTDHPIARDMRGRMARGTRFRDLTDAQERLLRKLHAEEVRKREEGPEVHVPAPITGKRQRVEGTVVSAKLREGRYGDEYRWTLRVDAEGGSWLAWGSIPAAVLDAMHAEGQRRAREREQAERAAHYAAALPGQAVLPPKSESGYLEEVLRGSRVGLDALLEPGREPHFAFLKRPSKATVLSWS